VQKVSHIVLLQALIGIIYAQLFQAVCVKHLKPIDVQQTCTVNKTFMFIYILHFSYECGFTDPFHCNVDLNDQQIHPDHWACQISVSRLLSQIRLPLLHYRCKHLFSPFCPRKITLEQIGVITDHSAFASAKPNQDGCNKSSSSHMEIHTLKPTHGDYQ
jgi:hypothetical protein